MSEFWRGDRCFVNNKPGTISGKRRSMEGFSEYQFVPDYEEPSNTWYSAEDIKPEEQAVVIEDLIVYRQLVQEGIDPAIARATCQQFLDNP